MAENRNPAPGAILFRADIMEIWGGSPQGGIAPANKSNSVLLYSDPAKGEQFGYLDGWLPDDGAGLVFEYTGHGQSGPQQMRGGNRAVRDRAAKGHLIRVFTACGMPNERPQPHRYLGEFELKQVIRRDALGADGQMRSVIVFRLRPKVEPYVRPEDFIRAPEQTSITTWRPVPEETTSRQIPAEANRRTETERRALDPVSVTRREAELSDRFEAFLHSQGHQAKRYEIRVKDDPGILRTDLFDTTDRVLYEAKGVSRRDEIRKAIGQLADYSRHIQPKPLHQAILLPSKPSDDLVDLIKSQQLALVYEHQGDFIGWPVRT